MCTREFLHFLRIREWQDLESQLRSTCRQIGLTVPSGRRRVDVDGRSCCTGRMLPGLLEPRRACATSDGGSTTAPAGASFSISPGSSLFRANPTG